MVLLSFVLQDIYSILILEAQLSRKAQDTNQKQRKQENKKTRKENKIQTKNVCYTIYTELSVVQGSFEISCLNC